MKNILGKVFGVCVILFIVYVSFFYRSKNTPNPDFLWNVIQNECVVHQNKLQVPDPCDEVVLNSDGKNGFVVYKDIRGPLQYLLMPTAKVTGIESAEILSPTSPNYFYEAWKARSFMEKRFNAKIPEDVVSLAINSKMRRSQNQLHIHISCVRRDVSELVKQNYKNLTEAWSIFPSGLVSQTYLARRVSAEDFENKNAFQLLAEFPEAKDKMGQFGLALVVVKDEAGKSNFVLLANKVNLDKGENGHAEDLQDHSCPQLYPPKGS